MKQVDLKELKSLEELIYQDVKVTTTDGKIFEGIFSSYTRADDAYDGLESIGIRYPNHVESFDKTFIQSIEIIEEQDKETPVLNIVKRKFPSRKLPQEVIQAIELLDSYMAQSSLSAH
jgi:hypothetical protein